MAYEDKFRKWYTGRVYQKSYRSTFGDRIEYNEVTTVGMQGLVEGDPAVLDDDDYLSFVLGTLAGF